MIALRALLWAALLAAVMLWASGCANVCVLIATPAGATCWSGNVPEARPAPSAGCSTGSDCTAPAANPCGGEICEER
jgi:hypothetical protein